MLATDGFDAVLIGKDAGVVAAIEAAGGRLVRRLDWADVANADFAERTAVVVEARGAEAAALAEALPLLAAGTMGSPTVVALDDDQIDMVAAHLLGAQVQLLCMPSPAERVAALVLAARMGEMSAGTALGEDDAARLARVNAEVARIADMLARLARQEPPRVRPDDGVGERALSYAPPPVEARPEVQAAEIRRVIRARRLRDKAFGDGLFEDPAWDMLLDLFAATLERAEVSVSSLCIAAAVAPTTALRWIGRLSDLGLLRREADPFDRRRALMFLSDTALGGMHGYVALARAQGLPLV